LQIQPDHAEAKKIAAGDGMSATRRELTNVFVEMFGCDAARITNPLGVQMFLIIGHKRHTKQDEGQWHRNGEPIDFEYLQEQVIASGTTAKELYKSARAYKRMLEREGVTP
jgi:hypothetical protein